MADDQLLTTGRRMKMIQNAYPEFGDDPAALYRVAQSPQSDDDMLKSVGTIVGISRLQTQIKVMNGFNKTDQRKQWESLPVERRAALIRAGYQAPEPPKKGLLDAKLPIVHTQLSGVGKVAAAGPTLLTKGIKAVGGKALDLAQGGSDATLRAYNATSANFSGSSDYGARDAILLEQDEAMAALQRATDAGEISQATRSKLLANQVALPQVNRSHLFGLMKDTPKPMANYWPDLIKWYREESDPAQPAGWTSYKAYQGGIAGAWANTGRKERNFRPEAERTARSLLENNEGNLFLAKRVAAADGNISKVLTQTLEESGLETGTPEFYAEAQRLQMVMSDERFSQASMTLAEHRIGPGADTARGLVQAGWLDDENRGIGKVVKVTSDLAFMFKTDPITPAMKLVHGIRAARWTAESGSVIAEIEKTQAVANGTADLSKMGTLARVELEARVKARMRAADSLADAFSGRRSVGAVLRESPQLERHMAFLSDVHSVSPIRSGDDVLEAWKVGAGPADLSNTGLRMARTNGRVTIPKLTATEFRRQQAFGWVRTTVEKGAELQGSGIGGKLALFPRGASKMLVAVGTQQPREAFANVNDINAFRRALKLGVFTGVPLAQRDAVLDQLVRGVTQITEHVDEAGMVIKTERVNTSVARDAWRAFYDQVFAHTGISATSAKEEARVLFARIMDRKFAVDNIDAFTSPNVGTRTASGVYPMADFSANMQIPRFDELVRAADTSVWLQRTYGFVNHRWLESFMSKVWKPLVLLRGGFIVRNAGEEVMRFMLMEGPGAYMSSVTATSALKRELAATVPTLRKQLGAAEAAVAAGTGTERAARELAKSLEAAEKAATLAPFKPVLWFVDRATGATAAGKGNWAAGNAVAGQLSRVRPLNHIDKMAHVIAGMATRGFRFGFASRVDPEYLLAARTLANNPRVLSAWAESIGGAGAIPGEYMSDIARQLEGKTTGATPLVEIKAKFARSDYFESAMNGDPTAMFSYAVEVERGRADPTFTAINNVLRGAITPELQFEFESVFRGTRWFRKLDPAAKKKTAATGAEVLAHLRASVKTIAPQADTALRDAYRAMPEAFDKIDDLGEVTKFDPQILRESRLETLLVERLGSVAEPSLPGPQIKARVLDASAGTNEQQVIDSVLRKKTVKSGDSAGKAVKGRIGLMRRVAKNIEDAGGDEQIVASLRWHANHFAEFETQTAASRLSMRARQMVLSDAKFRLADEKQIRRMVKEAMVARIQEPEVARFAVETDHMYATAGGVPLAQPAASGMQGMYWPQFDPGTRQAVLTMAQSGELEAKMAELTASEFQKLQQFLGGADAEALGRLRALKTGPTSPVSTVAYSSYHEAEDVSKLLHNLVGTEPLKGTARVHWTDVANPVGSDMKPGKFVHGSAPKQFVPGELQVRRLEKNASYADAYTVPSHLLAEGQPLDLNGLAVDLGDGVVRPGVSRKKIVEDYAQKLVDRHLNNYLTETGEIRHEILQPVARGESAMWHIGSIPADDLPRSVIVNRMYIDPDKESLMRRVTNVGFDALGAGVNAISRQPIFTHYFAEALKTSDAVVGEMFGASAFQKSYVTALEAVNGNSKKLGELTDSDLWAFWDDVMRDRSPTAGAVDVPTFRNELKGYFKDPDTGADLLNITDDEARALRDGLAERQHFRQLGIDMSIERAVNSMLPYIDDHRERSYLAQYVRGAVPFLYAEEQFLKRWGRVALTAPEAFHRAQLYMGAGRKIGFITQNEDGEDVFTYPFTPALQRFIADTPLVSQLLLKGRTNVPTVNQITGKVRDSLPGVAQPGALQPGPVFQWALGAASTLFPEAKQLDQDLYGPRSKQALWERFLPAYLAKGIKATANADPAYFDRLTIQSAAVMYATGTKVLREAAEAEAAGDTKKADRLRRESARYIPHGDPDPLNPGEFKPASEAQLEQWQDEVRRYARSMMLTQAVFQFGGPTGGRITSESDLSPEFIKELQLHDSYPEALAEFLRKNPDGQPFTVFSSYSPAGLKQTNYTEAAKQWVDSNEDLVKDHPLAGAWFMPQGKEEDPFDYTAMQQQYATGMRGQRTPIEWYEALKVAEASRPYFEERDRRDAALDKYSKENGGTVAQRKAINAGFQQWARGFKQQHPIFNTWLNSRASVARREAVRLDVTTTAQVNRLPDTVQAQVIAEMTAEFGRYKEAKESLAYAVGPSKGIDGRRDAMRLAFRSYGERMMEDYPESRAYWESIIMPDADFSED